MINISQAVEDVPTHDDVALTAARLGWLNLSSYARSIRPQIENLLQKPAQEGSIVTALARLQTALQPSAGQQASALMQGLSVHVNLEGITYGRSRETSSQIREIYAQISSATSTYLTVTQGINEITIIAEAKIAQKFREQLTNARKIYDKTNLVGITIKFDLAYLETPNLIFAHTRRLAYKDINIIEVVSTATELTYMIERKNLSIALEQLQKNI